MKDYFYNRISRYSLERSAKIRKRRIYIFWLVTFLSFIGGVIVALIFIWKN